MHTIGQDFGQATLYLKVKLVYTATNKIVYYLKREAIERGNVFFEKHCNQREVIKL
jgi:hypothetical protein